LDPRWWSGGCGGIIPPSVLDRALGGLPPAREAIRPRPAGFGEMGLSVWWKTVLVVSLAVLLGRIILHPAAAEEPVPSSSRPQGDSVAASQPAGREQAIELRGVAPEALKGFAAARTELLQDGQATGYVDWSRKVLVALGRSQQRGNLRADALAAQRAAKLIALRNSLAAAAGVPIGPNGQVQGLRNGRIVLEGFVKDFEVKRTYSRKADGVTYWFAEVEIPLFGVQSLAARFYDDQLAAYKAMAGGAPRAAWSGGKDPRPDSGDVLVIDARGLGFEPTMFPQVVNSAGQVLLDMETCEKAVCVDRGPCAYGTAEGKLQEIQEQSRQREAWGMDLAAGPGGNIDGVEWWRLLAAQSVAKAETAPAASAPATQPGGQAKRFVFRASGVQEKKAVLVIAEQDSLKMLADPHAAGLAKEGKVLVVVDAAAAGLEGQAPRPDQPPQAGLAGRWK